MGILLSPGPIEHGASIEKETALIAQIDSKILEKDFIKRRKKYPY